MKAKNFPCIYAFVNSFNGSLYVGSTKNAGNRIRQHLSELRRGVHHSKFFQNAWNKYGENVFMFCVIEKCPIENLIEREQFWLDNFKPFLYNLSDRALPAQNKPCPETTKEILRERMMGNSFGKNKSYCGFLKEQDIPKIFQLFANGKSTEYIGNKFNVDKTHISRILNRKVWASVEIENNIFLKCRIRSKSRNRGSIQPKGARLSVKIARDIKFSSEPAKVIADKYNICRDSVYNIRNGKTWKNLQPL